jgi:hypothetical protein
MSPSYDQWRRFRLESLIAARHSFAVASQLGLFATNTQEILLRASQQAPAHAAIRPETGLSARASVLGLSIVEIIDPTICKLDWRWLPVP